MAELAAKLADIEIELMDKRTEALSAMRKIGWVIVAWKIRTFDGFYFSRKILRQLYVL